MMNNQFPTLPSVARPLYSRADARSISATSSEDTSWMKLVEVEKSAP